MHSNSIPLGYNSYNSNINTNKYTFYNNNKPLNNPIISSNIPIT